MRKKLQNLVNGGAGRILVVLLLSLVLCVGTIELCAYYAKKIIINQADTTVKLNQKYINHLTSASVETFEYSCRSFASSIGKMDLNNKFVFLDKDLKTLDESDLYEMLESFLSVNSELPAAAFVFEKNVINGRESKATGAAVIKESGTRMDLVKENLFKESYFEENPGTETHWINMLGWDILNFDACYAIPFMSEKGIKLGELWCFSNFDYMGRLLDSIKPFKYTKLAIVDQNYTILASNQWNWTRQNIIDVVKQYSSGQIDSTKLSIFKKIIDNRETQEANITFGRNSWRVYISPVEGYSLSMMMFLDSKMILAYFGHIKFILLTITLCGALLIFCCLLYSFKSYKDTSDKKLKVDKELDIAADIQKSFLPKNNISTDAVDATGFQCSALSVGGDLYDMFIKDGKLFFCIGDVAGKGVPACMMMAMICSHFRSAVHNTEDPARIMKRINDSITLRNESMMFCTMFIGVLDLENGDVAICNAGHDSPAILNGNSCSYMEVAHNLPIGVMPDFEYQANQTSLAKGSAMFLFTDGVPEAENTAKDLYGMDRLQKLLKSIASPYCGSKINDAVLASVRAFSKGAAQSDDITMLSIYRK